jgi:hypothetical protein
MKPRKTCVYCRKLFDPYPALYRRQRACREPTCQRQRRRDTNRTNYRSHRYDSDYRWEKKKDWRQRHGRNYMRHYRKEHLEYVKANRRQQKRRNQRNRQMIVKSDVWKSLCIGKLMRINILESDCKFRRIRLLPL